MFVRGVMTNGAIVEADDIASIDSTRQYKFTNAVLKEPPKTGEKAEKSGVIEMIQMFTPMESCIWVGWIQEQEHGQDSGNKAVAKSGNSMRPG